MDGTVALETQSPSTDTRIVGLTDAASVRLAEIIREEGTADTMFRIAVMGGGCSGYKYGMSFDDTKAEDDHVFSHNGVSLVIDDMSLDLLNGAEIDFVDNLMGSYFEIRNPNAKSGCGCGSSFST